MIYKVKVTGTRFDEREKEMTYEIQAENGEAAKEFAEKKFLTWNPSYKHWLKTEILETR